MLAGRSLWDRFHTLWASWAVEQQPYGNNSSATPLDKPISKIWFGGDTGLRSVPQGSKQEEMPICPVFKQIGERFGGFDLAVRPADMIMIRT
jgi:N-acyl-phosphatidylethanolamine-hydrolysing phospholipase D